MSGRLAAAVAAIAAVVATTLWGVLGGHGQAVARGRSNALPHPTFPASSASSSSASSSQSGPAGSGWHLKFSSDFSGSKLNTKVWGTCYPWVKAGSGCSNFGTGNREYEWYLPSQDRVSGGVLHLVAERQRTVGRDSHGRPQVYSCRSGLVSTYPSFRFKYGYVQVVARIPNSYGTWTALWLGASNLKWPPEIDILEHWGTHRTTDVFLHPLGGHRAGKRLTPGNLSVGWHTFGLSWTRTQLVWFMDGHAVLAVDKNVPHQSMYFLANLAESKAPKANRGCSGTLLIQSVKVWQQ